MTQNPSFRKSALQFLIITVWSILVSGICLYCSGRYRNHPQPALLTTDTATSVDTHSYVEPLPVDSTLLRHQVVRLPVVAALDPPVSADTTSADTADPSPVPFANAREPPLPDSASVIIPITQKKYTAPDYTAYVSGYHPRLDSLLIHRRTLTVTNTVTAPVKARRWNVGLQVGYGITPKGFQPYLGVGVSFNLFK